LILFATVQSSLSFLFSLKITISIFIFFSTTIIKPINGSQSFKKYIKKEEEKKKEKRKRKEKKVGEPCNQLFYHKHSYKQSKDNNGKNIYSALNNTYFEKKITVSMNW